MRVTIDDKEMAIAVLNCLPSIFKSRIVALDDLGNREMIFGLERAKTRLLQEEKRTNMKDKVAQEPMLVNLVPETATVIKSNDNTVEVVL